MRIILAPVILVCAALGFLALEASRRAHWYGWTAPAMAEHWERLFATQPFDGEFYHAAKNIMSEWVRLDPQSAGKLFSFVIIVLIVLLIAK